MPSAMPTAVLYQNQFWHRPALQNISPNAPGSPQKLPPLPHAHLPRFCSAMISKQEEGIPDCPLTFRKSKGSSYPPQSPQFHRSELRQWPCTGSRRTRPDVGGKGREGKGREGRGRAECNDGNERRARNDKYREENTRRQSRTSALARCHPRQKRVPPTRGFVLRRASATWRVCVSVYSARRIRQSV